MMDHFHKSWTQVLSHAVLRWILFWEFLFCQRDV